MQEPASAAASLVNLWAHAHGFARLRRSWAAHVYPLRTLWTGYAVLSVNAWAWSFVFHCRDVRATEVLDYVSVDALLTYTLFAVCVRALRLFRPAQWLPLAAVLSTGLVYHCWRMLTVRFDYGANVAVRAVLVARGFDSDCALSCASLPA